MSRSIHSENVKSLLTAPDRNVVGKEILAQAIDGMRTYLHAVLAGQSIALPARENTGLVYLFTAGKGTTHTGGKTFEISDIALFAPEYGMDCDITAGQEALEILELAVDLNEGDLRELERTRDQYPYFISYSECSTYKEKIKSPKTISRTLMPKHTYPRLCVGSVATAGDDHVAAHEHPMLEQLFYGLKGNQTVVHADELSTEFGENVLLHIPLGSCHSVDVKAPDKLHYIWIDLFRDKKGMDWITQEHHTEQ